MNSFKQVLLAVVVSVWIPTGLLFAKNDPATEKFTLKPLRDPFWPIGYTPEGWTSYTAGSAAQQAGNDGDWKTPASMIRVSGTSRMGDQTVAVINGELLEVGDFISIEHNGRTFRWILKEVFPNGKISLERAGISSRGIDFKSGDKK